MVSLAIACAAAPAASEERRAWQQLAPKLVAALVSTLRLDSGSGACELRALSSLVVCAGPQLAAQAPALVALALRGADASDEAVWLLATLAHQMPESSGLGNLAVRAVNTASQALDPSLAVPEVFIGVSPRACFEILAATAELGPLTHAGFPLRPLARLVDRVVAAELPLQADALECWARVATAAGPILARVATDAWTPVLRALRRDPTEAAWHAAQALLARLGPGGSHARARPLVQAALAAVA